MLSDTLYALLASITIATTPADTETREEQLIRLRLIADDAASQGVSVEDALLILAVSQHESGFNQRVDLGPCYRGKDGRGSQCDYGKAACMMQIHGSDEQRASYFKDRKKCFSAGLKALKYSMAVCREQGVENQFSAYASGSCINPEGHKGSAELYRYWVKWKSMYAAQLAKEKN